MRYYAGTTEITRAMRSSAGWPVILARGAAKTIIMKITVLRTAAIGSLKPGTVGVTWTGDGTRTDLVKGVVKVIR